MATKTKAQLEEEIQKLKDQNQEMETSFDEIIELLQVIFTKDSGVCVKMNGVGITKSVIIHDIKYLNKEWQDVKEKNKKTSALQEEVNHLREIVRIYDKTTDLMEQLSQ